ncbi:coiled-coil domain-containing protein SCD2-like [Humulus lupulus]|uniref:coiled-coil domain-containing protein SCD2-like n=1 Tax=Humulus lupulus TaxID=3486 RepID=UPI002B40562F|nr:coiled-coil domain-containing protein SCD2-like [Humulus lupulus]
MDRNRHMYSKQNNSGTGTPGTPSSPMASPSPMHRHVRASSATGLVGTSNNRKAHNAKAAAQRLAHVMANQSADEDDDEDDLLFDYGSMSSSGTGSLGLGGGRAIRPRSPMTVVSSGPRTSPSPLNVEKLSSRFNQSWNNEEQAQSAFSVTHIRSPSQQSYSHEQPSSARSTTANRPSLPSPTDQQQQQPPSARSPLVTRPHLGIKTVPMVPPSVPLSIKPLSSSTSPDVNFGRDKRLSLDLGSMNLRELSSQRSSSALQDELDMLQEENDSLLEKLRLAEERCEEAEARARQLEKQVANLGEGVSLEARLLSRKEAALQQREAAVRVAEQTGKNDLNSEVAALRMEAETARDEATSALENLHESENELKSLRITTQRMILNKEEMEEVVLKRCWLARYWGLCVQHGIHTEIASARYEYWSSLAPLPVEVVLSAGHKAKEHNEERKSEPRDLSEFSGDGNIENLLIVEKGLRELASLKVGDAVALAMAQHRRPVKSSANGVVEELKLPCDGYFEAFELSKEESDDVLFKQAWLTYFWRRAKDHGVEPDIAEERLQYWIDHDTKSPTSQDAVDVERGLMELRKLGIETQLWEESRKELELDTNRKIQSQYDF